MADIDLPKSIVIECDFFLLAMICYLFYSCSLVYAILLHILKLLTSIVCVLVNIQMLEFTSYLFELLFESLLYIYFIIVFFHKSVVNIFVLVKVSESMPPEK